jgi:hypothetical protein
MIIPVVLLGEITVRLIKDKPDSPFAISASESGCGARRLSASLPVWLWRCSCLRFRLWL